MSSPSSRASSSRGTVPVMVIAAPTATGKTALVRALFGKGSSFRYRNSAEIISADSQAVYRGLDIGTAKPSPEERRDIPYHLIDIASPFEQFGLGDFMSAAGSAVEDILGRGHIPVMVGGTGFYIRSFLTGAPEAPESSPLLRESLTCRLKAEGSRALYGELRAADPLYAARIHENDGYRIVRALEVISSTGRPLSSYAVSEVTREGFSFLTVVLERDRTDLYERIDRRVDELFRAGLEDEVRRLKSVGCDTGTPAMKAIGYREFFDPSLTSAQEIAARIRRDSRRYAKRQITYLRTLPGAITVSADDTDRVLALADRFFSEWLP